MNLKIKKFEKGFTLIELLVVVAIIGILSSITMASLNSARAKARDARRMSDLSQIRNALYMYFDKYGNWMEAGSGCGYNGDGNGWFNIVGGIYLKAMSQCLIDNNFTGGEIIDPTGGKSSSPSTGFSYMKYSCNSPTVTYIYAKLEGKPQSSTAVDGTCCPDCDSSYGMNYYVSIK